MQPIEYRGFRITADSHNEKYCWYIYTIEPDNIFDASPFVYDSEEEAIDDAKFFIDKYHDTK